MKVRFFVTVLILITFIVSAERGYPCGGGGGGGNEWPVAVLTADKKYVLVNEDITFYGNSSYDPDGSLGINGIVGFEWDFNSDGYYERSETQSNPEDGTFDGITTHSYGSAGTYTAKLRVADNDDAEDIDTVTVYVSDSLVRKYVRQDGAGTGDGNSWGNAEDSIQDALAPSSIPAGQMAQIWVAEGTYKPAGGESDSFVMREGVDIYGGFSGDETSLDQRNWRRYQTVLSGDVDSDGLDGDNCFHVVVGASFSVLDGFTVTGGYADGSGYDCLGGGIFCNCASPAVRNCVIKDNYASGYGGGMDNIESSNPDIINCIFHNNSSDSPGGGMRNAISAPALINCVFTDNTASVGGAIHNQNGSSPAVVNCTFTGNSASGLGGGMRNMTGCSPEMTNCIFWANSDTAGTGQSAQISGGSPTVTYSCIQDDDAGDGSIPFGGATNHNIDVDPLFADAQRPAGSDGIFGTKDDGLSLMTGSPCAEQGNGNVLPAEVTIDVVGANRIANGDHSGTAEVDMGAYELARIWYVDADANTGGDGKSWSTAFKYLQDALNNKAAGGDEVWAAAGVYYPDEDEGGNVTADERQETFQLVTNAAVYGGFAGGETVRQDRNFRTNETILSGDIDNDDVGLPDGSNSYHVVTGADGATLDGFTIEAGYANGSGADDKGAGIYCDGTSPKITNCIITSNKSGEDGAGVYCDNSLAEIINCLFYGNWARVNGGGAYCNGSDGLRIINSTITGNRASGDGGGLYCNTSRPVITNCIFWENVDNVDRTDESAQIYVAGGAPDVSYSCIQDDDANDGSIPFGGAANDNIDDGPVFINDGCWDWKRPDGQSFPEYIDLNITDTSPDIAIYDQLFTHSDFQRGGINSTTEDPCIVEEYLDGNKKPVYNGGTAGTTSGVEHFDLWYKDDAKRNGINTNMRLNHQGNGIFRFDSSSFFPIDGQGLEDDKDDEYGHNYWFTLQYHAKCTYRPGQTLSFSTSDDLFIFINDRLVLDYGGIYIDAARTGSLNLDQINQEKNFGLKDGDVCDFDLFWAQRYTLLSVLILEKSIEMEPFYTAGDYRLQPGSPCINVGSYTASPADLGADIAVYPRISKGIVDMGAYEFQYPIADAGADQSDIDLDGNGAESITLDGTDSGDPDGTITDYLWQQGSQQIATGSNPTVDMSIGTHTITLTVTADDGAVDTDEVVVTVHPRPWVDAGSYFPVYCDETLQLAGQIKDNSSGYIVSTEWSVAQKPMTGSVAFGNAAALDSTADFTDGVEDDYILQLVGKNESGQTVANDTATIEVKVRPGTAVYNEAPGVVIDEVNSITLPTNCVNLNATVTDDGLPYGALSYQWSVVIHPLQAAPEMLEFVPGKTAEDPKVIFPDDIVGDYVLKLTADDYDKQGSGLVRITVEGNKAPQVYAGEDNSYDLPENGSVTINMDTDFAASADDPDSQPEPLDVTWSVVKGPAGGMTFSNSKIVNTAVTFTKPGVYVLCLEASDGDKIDVDWVEITINQYDPTPEVEAGENKFATIPYNSNVVDVELADAEATEKALPLGNMSISWQSSPSGDVTFSDNAAEKPTLTFTQKGVYTLTLTATDEGQLPVSDTVWVSVEKEPDPVTKKKAIFAGMSKYGVNESGAVFCKILDEGYDWQLIGSDLGGTILCLCEYDGDVYAGGSTACGLLYGLGKVWKWDGASWIVVGDNMDHQVCSLVVFQDELYAGTAYVAGDKARLYRYNQQDRSWTRVVDCDEDSWQGFRAMYVWPMPAGGDAIYTGNIGSDLFGHYDGTVFYHDDKHEGSCIWDIEGYNGHLYASAKNGLYRKKTAEDKWEHIAGDGSDCWEVETFGENLYIGQLNSLYRHNDSDNWVQDNNWYGHGADIISMIGDTEALFIGLGAEAGYECGGGRDNHGKIYSYNGIDVPELISDGLELGTGVQALLVAEIYPPPAEGTFNIAVTSDANGCVSPNDEITYTIDYNIPSGQPGRANVRFVDSVPVEVDFVSVAEPAAVYDQRNRTITWYFAELDDGAQGSLHFTVRVNNKSRPDGVITHYLGIKGDDFQAVRTHQTDVCWWANNDIIYVNPYGLGYNGCSWEYAYTDLQQALEHARYCNGHVQIWVAAGIYFPGTVFDSEDASFVMVNDVNLYGGFAGFETSLDQRDIYNPANETILSGVGHFDFVVTGEDNSLIDGFTIEGGTEAGIRCDQNSPTIRNNVIQDNADENCNGGGIYVNSATPLIENNIIGFNYNGIYCSGDAGPVIKNNWIGENHHDTDEAAGIWIETDNVKIYNNTIVNNHYGISQNYNYDTQVYNCIVWGNGTNSTDDNIYLSNGGSVDYSCVGGGWPGGTGNIDDDLELVDPANGDYHLKPTSPCIDAAADSPPGGLADADIDGDLRNLDGKGDGLVRPDMGADEYTLVRVEAGSAKAVTMITNPIELCMADAAMTCDGLANPSIYPAVKWSQKSGPAGGVGFTSDSVVIMVLSFRPKSAITKLHSIP